MKTKEDELEFLQQNESTVRDHAVEHVSNMDYDFRGVFTILTEDQILAEIDCSRCGVCYTIVANCEFDDGEGMCCDCYETEYEYTHCGECDSEIDEDGVAIDSGYACDECRNLK